MVPLWRFGWLCPGWAEVVWACCVAWCVWGWLRWSCPVLAGFVRDWCGVCGGLCVVLWLCVGWGQGWERLWAAGGRIDLLFGKS